MSDCNVCLDQDDGDRAEFWHTEIVRARKAHRCYECQDEIPVGAEHERCAMKYNGAFSNFRTCLACVEIHRALTSCRGDSEQAGFRCLGILWNDIEEYIFPGNDARLHRTLRHDGSARQTPDGVGEMEVLDMANAPDDLDALRQQAQDWLNVTHQHSGWAIPRDLVNTLLARLDAQQQRLDTEQRHRVEAGVVTDLVGKLQQAQRETQRETELRREAEAHNLELRAALDEKPYPDEWGAQEIAKLQQRLDAQQQDIEASEGESTRRGIQLMECEHARLALQQRLDAVTAWLNDFKRAGTPMAGIVAAQYADRLAAVLTGEAQK